MNVYFFNQVSCKLLKGHFTQNVLNTLCRRLGRFKQWYQIYRMGQFRQKSNNTRSRRCNNTSANYTCMSMSARAMSFLATSFSPHQINPFVQPVKRLKLFVITHLLMIFTEIFSLFDCCYSSKGPFQTFSRLNIKTRHHYFMNRFAVSIQ